VFTETDRAFLERLDARAQACLSPADSARGRLRTAITGLRQLVGAAEASCTPSAELHRLLDEVWSAAAEHDPGRARTHARHLVHAVRGLGLDPRSAWCAVATAQEIGSLVVLAA
jgi:uncharacterized protein (DUF2267 family)